MARHGTDERPWTETRPRGSWPVFTCDRCGERHWPTANELYSAAQPAWWDSECKPPKPLTQDDVEWLLGTGRYRQ